MYTAVLRIGTGVHRPTGARFCCDVLWAKLRLQELAPLWHFAASSLIMNSQQHALRRGWPGRENCHLGDLHPGESMHGLESQSLAICQGLGLTGGSIVNSATQQSPWKLKP